jgi:hypothetical protein
MVGIRRRAEERRVEIAAPKRDKQPTKSSKAVVVRNLIS